MDAPFKVGFANPVGWLAYWLKGVLFVKYAGYESQAAYPDYGCSANVMPTVNFWNLKPSVPCRKSSRMIPSSMWRLGGSLMYLPALKTKPM